MNVIVGQLGALAEVDVLVIGAGSSGCSAAIAARESGADKVLICGAPIEDHRQSEDGEEETHDAHASCRSMPMLGPLTVNRRSRHDPHRSR